MSRFTIEQTPLTGLLVLHRNPIKDERGYFERLFCETELQTVFSGNRIAQINHSQTKLSGMVRGMHYQRPPSAEKKIVSCIAGEVWDISVDIRQGSPTFLQWHGVKLSADNHRSMMIPEGFAHGFQTLTDTCEMLYLHSQPFDPKSEAGLNATDPRLAISWPRTISGRSSRDEGHPILDHEFTGIQL